MLKLSCGGHVHLILYLISKPFSFYNIIKSAFLHDNVHDNNISIPNIALSRSTLSILFLSFEGYESLGNERPVDLSQTYVGFCHQYFIASEYIVSRTTRHSSSLYETKRRVHQRHFFTCFYLHMESNLLVKHDVTTFTLHSMLTRDVTDKQIK